MSKQKNRGMKITYSPDSMQITSRGGESLTLTGFSHLDQ